MEHSIRLVSYIGRLISQSSANFIEILTKFSQIKQNLVNIQQKFDIKLIEKFLENFSKKST